MPLTARAACAPLVLSSLCLACGSKPPPQRFAGPGFSVPIPADYKQESHGELALLLRGPYTEGHLATISVAVMPFTGPLDDGWCTRNVQGFADGRGLRVLKLGMMSSAIGEVCAATLNKNGELTRAVVTRGATADSGWLIYCSYSGDKEIAACRQVLDGWRLEPQGTRG